MPGVPSGRGCEACRKQKKKCDQKTPCSRCSRLRIPCVGSGQRRFQFKTQVGGGRHDSQDRSSSEKSPPKGTESDDAKSVTPIPRTPSTELISGINAFIATIDSSTDPRFNLAWTYGSYLVEIPRRLAEGQNEALETSVAALVQAHQDVCVHRRPSSATLNKYTRALRTLRTYLDDPAKASSTETLCAVMILLTCQGFLPGGQRSKSGHGAGAARLLKARQFYDRSNKFESMLVLSLRGPVVVEGIFNSDIQLTPDEWKTLIENDLDDNTTEGHMLLILARMPEFVKRGKRSLKNESGPDHELLLEMWSGYFKVHDGIIKVRDQMSALETKLLDNIHTGPQLLALIQGQSYLRRIYGFALMTGIIIGTVLNVVEPEDAGLQSTIHGWCETILVHARLAQEGRPLWSSAMSLFLTIAWIGCDDLTLRASIIEILREYESDFFRTAGTVGDIANLEESARHLRLAD